MSLRVCLPAFLLVLVSAALIACGRMPVDPLAYQREAAEFLLTGRLDEQPFSAALTLAAVPEAEAAAAALDARDFTLHYTAPVELAGLILTRQAGQVSLRRGGVVLDDPDCRFAPMLVPAMLFCIDCELGEAAVVRQSGTTFCRITAVDDEGRYLLWLDTDGIPRRVEAVVCGRTVTADVLRQPDQAELPT